MTDPNRLAILVGGGPAPGINSVIGAATIRACVSGIPVLGIRDGFSAIMRGDTSKVRPLDIEAVSRIHFRGGSCLGTARANPTKDPALLDATVESLKRLGVTRLITIGGDDTAFSALRLAEHSQGALRVVHVPKTIDNDLDLPEWIPTFGYQTARHVGTGIVRDLLVDAQTTSRWYFVVAMGRKAGHLALGIGKAAGATLTLIPEEFPPGQVRLATMVDTLAGAIVKRLAYGRPDGVAVLAEGLVERLDPEELAENGELERDEHDHIRLAEVDFGRIIKARVTERLKGFGIKTTIVSKDIGYELRCTDPIPFDMEYTRDLGYCAAKFLLEGGSGAMVTIQQGKFKPIKFGDMLDPETGRTRVRMVDIDTEYYKIARRYMLRLRRDDFADPAEIAKYAAATHITPDEFKAQLEYLVKDEPPPLAFGF
ncbi:MAG TPA: diphosphate--fructose-6-phosphate 1-phosphotransferase [Polyangiaceae bacterium]|jgi:6-phosphofructokinase 1|nr:diphosphate--fructose-6-phosphate 1-phosphotransferase [Polyangiaceae bacterium]